MKDRRVNLLLDILDIVGFEELDDEFGLKSDSEEVRVQVQSQTEREFEKRLSMRSL